VLDATQARRLAEILLMSLYTESNAIRLSLAPKFARLEPEDPIIVTYGGNNYRLRVVSSSLQPSGRTEVVCVQEHPETYSSLAEVQDPLGNANPAVALVEDSSVFLLDLPSLRDSDDVPGLYAAGGAADGGTPWPGCVLYKSDDGVVFSPAVALSTIASYGQAQTALGNFSDNVWDDTSNVLVLMISGTLASATDAELVEDRRKNLLAIGSPSTGWELVQFGTVVVNAPINGKPSLTLSHFLRGRFGTEWRAASHETGEVVVHLDFESNAVQTLESAIGELNQPRFYKAVTNGAQVATTPTGPFTNTMMRLRPYSPTHAKGTFDAPTGNDWSVAFNRRARKGFDLIDGSDIALGESIEKYEIDILDGFNGPVVRTITIGPGLPLLSGVNLAIDGATQQLTRASGNWITDGFRDGQWVDLAGFSNADNNQRYQITKVFGLTPTIIKLGNGPRTLITEASASGRTVQAVTPAFLYTEAQQIADGGVKSQFYCNIYQISGRSEIGRGIAASNVSIF
jgi:hypothetical protein